MHLVLDLKFWVLIFCDEELRSVLSLLRLGLEDDGEGGWYFYFLAMARNSREGRRRGRREEEVVRREVVL